MKRAVIFDFGGVLMKTQDYRPRLTWDERLNLTPGSVEHIVHGSESWRHAQTGKLSPETYWQDVASQLQLSAADLAQLQTDYFSGDVLDTELVAYIQELRADGHIVGLLSNDSPELLPKLERLGITALFDPLLVSADIGYMKPAPEAYEILIRRLNLPPDQIIFIDDMPANIAGAQTAGIHGILYQPAINLPQTLKSLLIQG